MKGGSQIGNRTYAMEEEVDADKFEFKDHLLS